MKRLVCLAAAVAAAFAVQSAAGAEDCYGLNAARACVTVYPEHLPAVDENAGQIEECVHLGSTCTPVFVPLPGVTTSEGQALDVDCYVAARTCDEIIDSIVIREPGR